MTTAMLWSVASHAQNYPNRPVRVVVGYGAGGSPDAVARLMADHLSKTLGQSFIVDNRVGASGTLASNFVAQSPADGYVLLIAETGQNEILPQMIKLPYHPINDFTYIGQLTRTPLVIVASTKSTQFKTLQDLITAGKANPGKINFGTSGIGSGQHLAWEAFKKDAGVNLIHVPYKGATQSVPALLAGEVAVMMGTYGSFVQHIKAGSLQPLAVASTARLASVPDIPHVAETVTNYQDFSSEIGLMAPRGLPTDILNRLADATRSSLDASEVKARLAALGLVQHWAGPQDYRKAVAQNLIKYKQAIDASGIKPE